MNLREAIAFLTAELDPETVTNLIIQFLADTPVQITAARAALGSGDLATLGRTAHSVAGSSSTFGLEELRQAAVSLETAAKAGETTNLPAQVAAVAAAFEATLPDLQRLTQQ